MRFSCPDFFGAIWRNSPQVPSVLSLTTLHSPLSQDFKNKTPTCRAIAQRRWKRLPSLTIPLFDAMQACLFKCACSPFIYGAEREGLHETHRRRPGSQNNMRAARLCGLVALPKSGDHGFSSRPFRLWSRSSFCNSASDLDCELLRRFFRRCLGLFGRPLRVAGPTWCWTPINPYWSFERFVSGGQDVAFAFKLFGRDVLAALGL